MSELHRNAMTVDWEDNALHLGQGRLAARFGPGFSMNASSVENLLWDGIHLTPGGVGVYTRLLVRSVRGIYG